MTQRTCLAFALALMVMVSPAGAQTPTLTQQPLPARSIKLTAEQSHIIKEIVLKDMKVPGVSGIDQVTIGAPAPDQVALYGFPDEVAKRVTAVKSHKFFVIGERIVIVDPRDNTVADVIE